MGPESSAIYSFKYKNLTSYIERATLARAKLKIYWALCGAHNPSPVKKLQDIDNTGVSNIALLSRCIVINE